MCGFAGAIKSSCKKDLWIKTLKEMGDTLAHRGPDDEGIWFDIKAGIGFSHRRLSIIDISEEGHQPMISECGRYIIVYNGEVYNFAELKKELEEDGIAPNWRGHSDTEVILAAISGWGLEDAVSKFIGMFAFALWDQKEKVLYLVRDRMGIKPLYFGWMNNTFLFGSELKALVSHPDFKKEIDINVVSLYLRHGYIPAPYSIYKGVQKLLPGSILTVRPNETGNVSSIDYFWSGKEVVERGLSEPFSGSNEEAIDYLDSLLRDSIKLRMISDVPLGAFLSGGIDSSTVVSLMQAQSTKKVKTFSIGFYEEEYNEAKHAKAVASHLGTDHTEFYVTHKEAMAVIPKIPTLYDEPFSDSSQIPTFLVSELTKKEVTVSLTGDGGDELFGGYNRYFLCNTIWRNIGWMPKWTRFLSSRFITSFPTSVWDTLLLGLKPLFSDELKSVISGDRLYKLSEIILLDDPKKLYRRLTSCWDEPAFLINGVKEPSNVFTNPEKWPDVQNFFYWMMYIDMVSYLPDDILVKVDRASMGVSLEVRVPIIDHRVVEFSWKIPLSLKVKRGIRKWLLRQVLYKYVPRSLIERPKTGFGIPISEWLRTSIRDWAEELLDEKHLKDGGIFNPKPILEKWLEHKNGIRNWHYYLWNILMFQAWLEENQI